jgi:hypothetical protein
MTVAIRKPRDPRPIYEIDIHKFAVDLLRKCAAPKVIWKHIPNGEKRDKGTAAKLKAMGLLPGAADIELIMPPLGVTACLELKRPGEKQEPCQVAYGLAIEEAGGIYEVADTPEKVFRMLGRIGALRAGTRMPGFME